MTCAPRGIFNTKSLSVGRNAVNREPREERNVEPSSEPISSACAITHANGVGQNYYDCVDAGTYNQTQAGKACTAYTNDQFACQAASCIGDAGDMVVCGTPEGGTNCVCWDYVGQDTSHVYKSGTTTCYCPGSTDPNWN